MNSRQEILDFAKELILEAGLLTLEYFKRGAEVDKKSDNTPVTEADREAERFIRRSLAKHYPDHGIIGEEFGKTNPDAEYQWIIDPIDGTQSFIHGIPTFTNLLALLHRDEAVLAFINSPATGELCWAAASSGAFVNGDRIRVRERTETEEMLILSNDVKLVQQRGCTQEFLSLIEKAGLHRTWCDAYGHMMVASGRADLMFDPYLSLWDSAPLKLIIEEAGGTYLCLDGSSNIHNDNGISCSKSAEMLFRSVFGL